MKKLEGHDNLYRDEESNAIINTDIAPNDNYINVRRVNSDKRAEMDDMKKELAELKSLLKELTSKITS